MNDFAIQFIDHLEISGLLSHDLPNVDTFIKNLFKITVVNITINHIRKVWILGSYQAHEYKFSKILIFTWKLEFYLCQQILSLVLLEVTARLPHLNNQSLSVISSKNGTPLQKQLDQQHATQSHKYLSGRKPSCFCMQQKCYRKTSYIVRLNTGKTSAQDLIKLVIFTASSKTFLIKTGCFLFFKLQACGKEEYNDYQYNLPLPWSRSR